MDGVKRTDLLWDEFIYGGASRLPLFLCFSVDSHGPP